MKTISAYRSFRQSFWPGSYQPRPKDWQLVHEIRHAAAALRELTDEQVAEKITQLRLSVNRGELQLQRNVVVSCFAATFEAVRRTISLEYYDVQILAGVALASGSVAEMKTGEGKTIVAALPATLRALAGKGVHVATVNAYLAERDFELLKPAYELLGLSVGHLRDQDKPQNKRVAYAADITYGTGYEFGFDYLRDQAALRNIRKPLLGAQFRNRLRGYRTTGDRTVQRHHAFAVIDEIDSVLIDEANTPLVLSSAPSGNAADTEPFVRALELARTLVEDEHFVIDRRRRSISLTETGHALIFQHQESFPVEGLVRPWQTYVEQAIRADHLLEKDNDYVIQEDVVRIVDQYTGRIFSDRTWRDGLHQAVETKEQVPVSHEKVSIGRISRQRYFGLYEGLCGMTGTATGHEREFQEFYELPIVVIPERVPNQRQAQNTRYFDSHNAKRAAIVDDIQSRHSQGQPVLVGTRTIDESEALATMLVEKGIPHQVLNGLQDQDEAQIVENAGRLRAVTIATNMAGRGTDIDIDEEVAALGGLHVIATQRQESLRVDRQLIGRAARQGRPGSCQFFVGAEDELIQQFKPGLTQRMQALANERGEIHRDFDSELDQIQRRAESERYAQRSELFRQDEWLNDVLTTVAENDTLAPETSQE